MFHARVHETNAGVGNTSITVPPPALIVIFLCQNQAAYLLSAYNPAKDEHIFASLSLSCVQAFSLRYIRELLA